VKCTATGWTSNLRNMRLCSEALCSYGRNALSEGGLYAGDTPSCCTPRFIKITNNHNGYPHSGTDGVCIGWAGEGGQETQAYIKWWIANIVYCGLGNKKSPQSGKEKIETTFEL